MAEEKFYDALKDREVKADPAGGVSLTHTEVEDLAYVHSHKYGDHVGRSGLRGRRFSEAYSFSVLLPTDQQDFFRAWLQQLAGTEVAMGKWLGVQDGWTFTLNSL